MQIPITRPGRGAKTWKRAAAKMAAGEGNMGYGIAIRVEGIIVSPESDMDLPVGRVVRSLLQGRRTPTTSDFFLIPHASTGPIGTKQQPPQRPLGCSGWDCGPKVGRKPRRNSRSSRHILRSRPKCLDSGRRAAYRGRRRGREARRQAHAEVCWMEARPAPYVAAFRPAPDSCRRQAGARLLRREPRDDRCPFCRIPAP